MGKFHLKIQAAILLISVVIFSILLWRSFIGVRYSTMELPEPVFIEVKGDVPAPGIHLLDSQHATLSDALAACGLQGLPVQPERMASGASVEVLRADDGPRLSFGMMRASGRLAAGLKLDLNSFSKEDLMLVPQMRPEMAESIVKRREARPWEKTGDLVEIHGIGPKTAQKLGEFLEVRTKFTKSSEAGN